MPQDRHDRTNPATLKSSYVSDTTQSTISGVATTHCTGEGFDARPAIRYITSRCGDRSLAEDITYDAIMTILSNEDLRREWTSLDLLFRVALNEYANQKRKAEGRAAHVESVSRLELTRNSGGRTPDYDMAIDVRDALARIDRESRSLILDFWSGYSYREMAEKKGVKESTIGMRLRRARKRFAEELRGYRQRGG